MTVYTDIVEKANTWLAQPQNTKARENLVALLPLFQQSLLARARMIEQLERGVRRLAQEQTTINSLLQNKNSLYLQLQYNPQPLTATENLLIQFAEDWIKQHRALIGENAYIGTPLRFINLIKDAQEKRTALVHEEAIALDELRTIEQELAKETNEYKTIVLRTALINQREKVTQHHTKELESYRNVPTQSLQRLLADMKNDCTYTAQQAALIIERHERLNKEELPAHNYDKHYTEYIKAIHAALKALADRCTGTTTAIRALP